MLSSKNCHQNSVVNMNIVVDKLDLKILFCLEILIKYFIFDVHVDSSVEAQKMTLSFNKPEESSKLNNWSFISYHYIVVIWKVWKLISNGLYAYANLSPYSDLQIWLHVPKSVSSCWRNHLREVLQWKTSNKTFKSSFRGARVLLEFSFVAQSLKSPSSSILLSKFETLKPKRTRLLKGHLAERPIRYPLNTILITASFT